MRNLLLACFCLPSVTCFGQQAPNFEANEYYFSAPVNAVLNTYFLQQRTRDPATRFVLVLERPAVEKYRLLVVPYVAGEAAALATWLGSSKYCYVDTIKVVVASEFDKQFTAYGERNSRPIRHVSVGNFFYVEFDRYNRVMASGILRK